MFIAALGLSPVAASGGPSLVAAPGLLAAVASPIAECGLQSSAALQRVGSSWIRDRTAVPCVARQVLNHWTIRASQGVILRRVYTEKRVLPNDVKPLLGDFPQTWGSDGDRGGRGNKGGCIGRLMTGPGRRGRSDPLSHRAVALCPALAVSGALGESSSFHPLEHIAGQSIGNYRQGRSSRNAIVLFSQRMDRLVGNCSLLSHPLPISKCVSISADSVWTTPWRVRPPANM